MYIYLAGSYIQDQSQLGALGTMVLAEQRPHLLAAMGRGWTHSILPMRFSKGLGFLCFIVKAENNTCHTYEEHSYKTKHFDFKNPEQNLSGTCAAPTHCGKRNYLYEQGILISIIASICRQFPTQ